MSPPHIGAKDDSRFFQSISLWEYLFAAAVVHPDRSCDVAKARTVAGVVAAAGIVHAATGVAVGIVAEVAGPTPVVAEAVAETKGELAVPIPAAGAVIAGPMSVAQVVEIEEAVDPTAGIDPIVAGAVAVVVGVAPSHFAWMAAAAP